MSFYSQERTESYVLEQIYTRYIIIKLEISKIFYKFAPELNLFTMADLNRIKVVLVEKKKSGKWLAEQLGISTCTVSKYCSNTVQPNLHTLDQIAKILEVDRRTLLNEGY